jgi:hypothetical protein
MPRTLIVAVAWLALGASAHAFDCKRASAPAQVVTCSDSALLRLYEERQHAYDQTRARLSGKQARALAADERRWIKGYPEGCGVTAGSKLPQPVPAEMQACFKRANQDRIAYLHAYPSPATPPAGAAQPAAAPPPAKSETQPPAAAPPPIKETPASKEVRPAPQAGKQAQHAPPPSKGAQPVAAAPGTLRLKFTFGCQTPAKLAAVLHALARNDYSFPLSQSDCLPIPDGTDANVLSRAGNVVKVRLCSAEAGCTDVYVDAGQIENGAAGAVPH